MLLWATYLAVMWGGLQAGIGLGIVFCTLYFAFSYARVSSPAVHSNLCSARIALCDRTMAGLRH